MKTLLLAAAALAASPAAAQQDPAMQLSDEQKWTVSIQQAIPAAELEAASLSAEAQGVPDPLVELAARHQVSTPEWLKKRIAEQGTATTLAALGDSITAGMASCAFPYFYCPQNSWSTGSLPTSLRMELEAQSGRDVRGLLLAVPGVTMAAMPAQAYAVFLASALGLNVQRMTLFIGHNDPGVCHAPADGEDAAFAADFATALRVLGHVAARRGARLYVASLMEVTSLARVADVKPRGGDKTCREIWQRAGLCAPVLQHLGDAGALARVSAQIAKDDETLRRLSAEKPWVLYEDVFNADSRSGIEDPAADMSPFDCFHPSAAGQARLGQLAWRGREGGPGVASFFALEPAPTPALSELRAQAAAR